MGVASHYQVVIGAFDVDGIQPSVAIEFCLQSRASESSHVLVLVQHPAAAIGVDDTSSPTRHRHGASVRWKPEPRGVRACRPTACLTDASPLTLPGIDSAATIDEPTVLVALAPSCSLSCIDPSTSIDQATILIALASIGIAACLGTLLHGALRRRRALLGLRLRTLLGKGSDGWPGRLRLRRFGWDLARQWLLYFFLGPFSARNDNENDS